MTTLAEADPLTRANARDQLRIARAAQREAVALWVMLSWLDLDGTTDAWLAAMTAKVLEARSLAAIRAARYYRDLRVAQIGEPPQPGPGTVIRNQIVIPQTATRPDDDIVARVAGALRLTGPVRVKQAVSRGLPREAAMQRGLAGVLGSVQKQVLDGGRQTTGALLGMEPTTTYYQRVVSSTKSCDFCQMLAERGPVYTATTGDFKAHDSCGCQIEPKFRGTKKRRSVGSGSRRAQWTEYDNVAPLSGPLLPTR